MRRAALKSHGTPRVPMSVLLAATAFLAVWLLWAGRSEAITACEDAIREVEGDATVRFTLLLDDIVVPQGIGLGDPELLAEALRFRIDSNLQLLRGGMLRGAARQRGAGFEVLVCQGRRPRNPGDIAADVEDFDKSWVILELWGFFDRDEAVFTHAVIPLYRDGGAPWIAPGTVFRYAFAYDPATSELKFLKDVLEGSLPLRALAAVGAALKGARVRHYDLARRLYCTAQSLLLQQLTPDMPAARRPRYEDLLAFVEKMSLQVIDEATGDPDYQGVLGGPEVPAGTSCGEGVS